MNQQQVRYQKKKLLKVTNTSDVHINKFSETTILSLCKTTLYRKLIFLFI